MPYTYEWKPSDPIQLLVWGLSKVGKTWGALTFPRPVVYDFDRGIATALNREFVKRYGHPPIFYEQFIERGVSKNGIVSAHNAFDDACRFFDECMKPAGRWKSPSTGQTYDVNRDMFDTIILDSGTTLSEVAQHKAVIVLGTLKLSKTFESAMKHGVVAPKVQDYGSERSLVEQFVDMVRSSGKNVVLICHEKELTTDEGVLVGRVPLLTGKSAELIPLKFDEVYRLSVRKHGLDTIRTLQTQPDGINKVGTRFGLPDGTEWNYSSIRTALDAIKAEQVASQGEGNGSPKTAA